VGGRSTKKGYLRSEGRRKKFDSLGGRKIEKKKRSMRGRLLEQGRSLSHDSLWNNGRQMLSKEDEGGSWKV